MRRQFALLLLHLHPTASLNMDRKYNVMTMEKPPEKPSQPLIALTRPGHDQAQVWMAALKAAGYSVCNIPLIAITPRQQERVAVQQSIAARCSAAEADCTGHMFVSASAVRAAAELAGQERFRALLQNRRQYWLAAGAGTMQAVRAAAVAAGVAADDGAADTGWQSRAVLPQHAAQYDSEHLWAELEKSGLHRQLRRICIYRGQDVQSAADGQSVLSARQYSRNWLADTARAHSITVQILTVYQRSLPQPVQLPPSGQPVQQPVVWVWSSSLAIENWESWQNRHRQHGNHSQQVARWHRADTAVCTHPRIAQRAAAAGFRAVYTCLPEPQALIHTLDGLRNTGV